MSFVSSRSLLRASLLGLAWAQLANLAEGLVQTGFFFSRDATEWVHSVLVYAWVGLALGLALGLVISGLELLFPFSMRRRLNLRSLQSPLLFLAFALAVGGYWLNIWPKMPGFTTAAGKLWTAVFGVALLGLTLILLWIGRRRARRHRDPDDTLHPHPRARVLLGLIVLFLVATPFVVGGQGADRGAELEPVTLDDRPPIIVILVDTLRRDHLGFYGYERDTSPFLDALADESIVFEASNTTGNFTIPATATFFTGLYPSAHGALHPHDRFPTDVPTFAERLRAAGYRTGAFVGNPTMRAEMGYARGFDTFHPAPPPRWIHHRKTALELIASRLGAGGDVSPTRNLVPRALDWLRQDDPRPPYLYLHLIDPHSGYVPPRAHFESFLPPGIEDGLANPPRLFDYNDEEWVPWEDLEDGPKLDGDAVLGMVARYDGEIHVVDEWIGRFLGAVEEAGLLDDALFVFISDHGEEFGEHQGWFHGETLYAEMVDMPLLLKLPQSQHGGTRTALSLDMVDLPVTIEGWIGMEEVEGRQGLDLSEPLRDLLEQETTLEAIEPERLTFTERPPRLASVERGSWKLIRRTVRGRDLFALYDLATDPGETRDLVAEQPEVRIELEALLQSFLANVAREGAITADEARDVDPETLRVLRTLGYVE